MAEQEPLDEDVPEEDGLLDQRKAFEEERRRGIFSTDVAAILGLSRYGTPLSVYRAKRGESERREMSLPAWIGLRLENLVAELYSAATSNRVRADNLAHFHAAYPWLGAHLDRRVIGDSDLLVELKTRNSTRGWGEDGSTDIPVDVWTQVQVQLFVVQGREAHVAVLFSNSSYRTYHVAPDLAFIESLIPTLREFWFDCVLAGVPPEVTGLDTDTEYVKKAGAAGGASGFIKAATPEQIEVVERMRLSYYNAAQAVLAKTALQNRVKQIIGLEADGLAGPFGRVMWKRTADGRETEWPLVAGVYKRAVERLLELLNPGEDDRLVTELAIIQASVAAAEDLYTRIRPGTRRFTVDFQEA